MCGGRSGAIWLPSYYPGGCCTLVVVEEIPPFYVKHFEYSEMRYINVTNDYYVGMVKSFPSGRNLLSFKIFKHPGCVHKLTILNNKLIQKI